MDSVDSSQDPSPGSSATYNSPGKPPLDLTPRSKIRAMLSALDDEDDSDKENQTTTTSAPLSKPQILDTSPVHTTVPTVPIDNSMSKQPEMNEKPKNHAYSHVQTPTRAGRHAFARSPNDAGNDEIENSPGNNQDSEGNANTTSQRSRRSQASSNHHSPIAIARQKSASISAGLFSSPSPSSPGSENVPARDPSKSPPSLSRQERLQALLSLKRKEMQDQAALDREFDADSEDEATNEITKQINPRKQAVIVESETDDDRSDREVAKRLTQQARPTRKASKKALEDMNRETQRMSRNMQLAHEARTKTKFTTGAFLAKFKFRQPGLASDSKQNDLTITNIGSSSAPATSDVEPTHDHETPPSSPPSRGRSPNDENATLDVNNSTSHTRHSSTEELADLKSLLSRPAPAASKHTSVPPKSLENLDPPTKRTSVRQFSKSVKPQREDLDLDDDIEIVDAVPKSRLKAFESLPATKAKESKPLHNLRLLAYLTEDERHHGKNKKNSISSVELYATLRLRAKAQAKEQRDEKIQRLKEKGVIVQTAEEKEQEQMQLDNMLERARKEAQDLAQREKEAAKKEGKQTENDFLDSEDEDEEYVEADGEDPELSGSEDELGDDEAEDEDDDEEDSSNELEEDLQEAGAEPILEVEEDLIDGEAGEDSEETAHDQSRAEHNQLELGGQNLEETISNRATRPGRKRIIVSDDEDDEDVVAPNASTAQPVLSTAAQTPKQRAANIFGFNTAHSPALGLSQVFAATMAESQTQADFEVEEDQDSLSFLRGIPPPDLPDFTTPISKQSSNVWVQDSQEKQHSKSIESQHSVLVSLDTESPLEYDESQISELPDPTQDEGFQVLESQPQVMAASYSTVDTVPLENSVEDDIVVQSRRRGRLVQKHESEIIRRDDSEAEPDDTINTNPEQSSVFQIMHKAAKKSAKAKEFNKKKSEAKEMFEEQAEESEDEYAGLGGASDDESNDEMDEETTKLIDDEDGARTDERDIAAYFAEKARADDERGIEQLYKDVINGGLRRKRGAEHDLWESDDEDEVAARRRAAKQKEFAKMRKALLADEKLGKIAENPKQEAFLQAIEDRDDLGELYLLDATEDDVSQVTDSQSAAAPETNIEPTSLPPGKRKYGEVDRDIESTYPEAQKRRNVRRAGNKTKPTSLADIRSTLSELIGEPGSLMDPEDVLYESPLQSGDENEDDRESEEYEYSRDKTNCAEMPPPPKPQITNNRRRTTSDALRTSVIDRMALKRAASSSSSLSGNSGDRLAFQSVSKSGISGFQVPSLLRRASTNGSVTSTGSSSESERSMASASFSSGSGGLGGKENVKMGGSKKSSVNYHVREQERQAKIDKVERERQLGRERVGKMRRTGVVSGFVALVGGQFG